MRVRRFAPRPEATTYEIVWSDGAREEIVGREAVLELVTDERRLARIVAKSTEPIRQVIRSVRSALDEQAELLRPIKPRVCSRHSASDMPNRSPGSQLNTGSPRQPSTTR